MNDHDLDDDSLDRMLAGAPANATERAVGRVLDLAVAADLPSPTPSVELAAIFESNVPASSATVTALSERRPIRRRRCVVVLAIAVGASAALGGAAAAGGLPDSLQSIAARAARVVGLDFPDPSRRHVRVDPPRPRPHQPVTSDPAESTPATLESEIPTSTVSEPVVPTSEVEPPDVDDDPVPTTDDPTTEVDDDLVTVEEDPSSDVDDDPVPTTEDPVSEVDDDPVPTTEDPASEVDDDHAGAGG